MVKDEWVKEAVAHAYNDAINILLAEAHAWRELSNSEMDDERRAEQRHIASALRRAADKIRERAREATD